MTELNFRLHKKQQEIFLSKARFKVVAAGRRGGKSYLSAVNLILKGLEDVNEHGYDLKNKEIWYIAPTFGQATNIMWNLLIDLGRPVIKDIHKNTATLTLINGRRIQLKGSDRPDTLRGVGVSYVVMDEYAFMKPEVWDLIIRPTLSDVKGEALFIGTPDGKNHFYDLWLSAHKTEGWEAFSFNSMDNPTIDPLEIENAKQTLSRDAFRQEYEASFSVSGGSVFKEGMFIELDDPPEPGVIYITVDPAGFGTGTNMVKSEMTKLDEMAIAVVEVSPSGWFVHKMIHGRWDVRRASLEIVRAAQKFRPAVVGIEKGQLMNAMLPYLQDQQRRLGVYFHIEPLTHGGKNKQARIKWALEGRFEHGRIFFKSDEEWIRPLKEQLLDFPNPLSHDDLPDALAYIDQIATTTYITDFAIDDFEPMDNWTGY